MAKWDRAFIETRIYFPLTEEHGLNYAESVEFQRVLRDSLKLLHEVGKAPKKKKASD